MGEAAPDGRSRPRLLVDALVVLLGGSLIVLAALQQPYNQNEWVQVRPYGSPDLGTALTGTRQPPLDPLLGVAVQRVLGQGQLEQRLVPMACGIATLALVAVLVRQLQLRWTGTLGLLFLATSPLFVRYSAYARPYALPLTLIVACAVVGNRWLDTGRRRWLVAAGLLAALLPLARVPEPTAFLTASALLLGLAGARRRLPRGRAWALAGALLAGLATTGTAMVLRLLAQSGTASGGSLVDTDPAAVAERVGPALTTVQTLVLPLWAEWFPWWPLTLAVLLAALVLGPARRALLGSWYWLPIVVATAAFLAAFLLLVPEGLRDYRIRFAYFVVPALALAVALVARSTLSGGRWLRASGALLAGALVVSQAPATWGVLTRDDAVDFARAGEVLEAEVPPGALVVLDGPGEVGRWRQGFMGDEHAHLPPGADLVTAGQLTRTRLQDHMDAGPTYLLVLDAACVSNVACSDRPAHVGDGQLAGYRVVERMGHVDLYAPTGTSTGLGGLLEAMTALVDEYGPARAVPDAIVAARILARRHRLPEALAVVDAACAAQPDPASTATCADLVDRRVPAEVFAPETVSWPPLRRSRA